MSILRTVGFAALRWLAETRSLQGLSVAVHTDEAADRPGVWAKLESALDLLARFNPRTLERAKAQVSHILVGPLYYEYRALWHADQRLIQIDAGYLTRTSAHPAHVAATITHEVTHGWLEGLGFAYVPARRARIEAICARSEAAFARRIPGGSPLAAYHETRAQWALEQGRDYWTQEEFAKRDRAALAAAEQSMVDSGAPEPLVSMLRWVTPDRSA